MVFAVEVKWVVKRLQRGARLAFTQFCLAWLLQARSISAMSILYQQKGAVCGSGLHCLCPRGEDETLSLDF